MAIRPYWPQTITGATPNGRGWRKVTGEGETLIGDKQVGVVWHIQGSGKSLTTAFYAGKIVLHPEMQNPTLVVLTDRKTLMNNYSAPLRDVRICFVKNRFRQKTLVLHQEGLFFTTAQKFFPEKGEDYPKLSGRRNIVVIADEVHRSLYDFIDGFARHIRNALPNTSFISFTGTSIEEADRNTPAVFGNHISIYDIQRAVEDGATVRIYYEARLAKLELRKEERPN